MATNLTIPSVGESITQVTILRWIKQEGEYVRRDDPVAELESDKANVELPANASGVLHPSKQPGYVAQVGEVVGQIDESAAPPKAAVGSAAAPSKASAAPAAAVTTQKS